MVSVIRGDDNFDTATSGVLELQSTATLSSTSSVEFTFASGAAQHIFAFENVVPASGASLRSQLYIGGSYSSSSLYSYTNIRSTNSSVSYSSGFTDTYFSLTGATVDPESGYGVTGEVVFSGVNSASSVPAYVSRFNSPQDTYATSRSPAGLFGVGYYRSLTAPTKVKFYYGGVNMSSGTIRYYTRNA